jgi:hypothetical protein
MQARGLKWLEIFTFLKQFLQIDGGKMKSKDDFQAHPP